MSGTFRAPKSTSRIAGSRFSRQCASKAPINKITGSDFNDYWNITTLKPIQHVEALPDIYSSSFENGGITIVADDDLKESIPEDQRIVMPMFIAMDRPKHTEERRVIAPAFTPAEMERMSDRYPPPHRRVARYACRSAKPFDWVDLVSIELTTGMLALLFDFPWEDRRLLTEWSDWAGDVELFRTEETRKAASGKDVRNGRLFPAAVGRTQGPGRSTRPYQPHDPFADEGHDASSNIWAISSC